MATDIPNPDNLAASAGNAPKRRGRPPKRQAGTGDGTIGGAAIDPNEAIGAGGAGAVNDGGHVTLNGVDYTVKSTDGNGGGAESGESPKVAESLSGGEAPKKRRGRPPGSGTRTAPKVDEAVNFDVRDMAAQIYGGYKIAAIVTGEPAFNITDGQATALAQALEDVNKHYPINRVVNGPVASLVKLAIVAGSINLPILATLAAKQAHRRQAARPAAQPATPDAVVAGDDLRRPYDFSGQMAN